MKNIKKNNSEWWHDFFDPLFGEIVLDRSDDQENEETLRFLKNTLSINSGARIYDQCCGTGSLSKLLIKNDMNVYGVDVIPAYIEKTKSMQNKANVFVCADARHYRPKGEFDAVINWYTSFGYSVDDEDNIKMLIRAFECLKVGGKIALDITNIGIAMQRAHSIAHYKKQTPSGLISIERNFFFDADKGMRGSHWKYIMPDGQVHEKEGSSRLFSPTELRSMLIQVGFKNCAFYGDLDCSPLTVDSPRCIVIAEK